MPLNYSKWDQLELSDDSDIEGHPNVDKKSLIRWKQRDIHEKREARNRRIAELEAEVACNDVLLTRLRAFQPQLAQSGSSRFSSEVDRLRTSPSPEAPPTKASKPVPYDEMILRLLETIAKEVQEQAGSDQKKLEQLLEERLDSHVKKLSDITEERRKETEVLLKEKAKHITMDDLHDGFESKYVPAGPEPPPVIGKGKEKNTTGTTHIEVLNPGSASSVPPTSEALPTDIEDELPYMTPSLEAFARLPLWDFEKSWLFIQNHRDVVVHGASDALLVAAFKAQREGNSKYAKQCVHQSLVLQYSEKLGKDGVQLFFRRMVAGGQSAQAIFRNDVEDTHAHIVKRVEITKAEEAEAVASGAEQIQLVAENPDTVISFNVPDGPPPEHLVLEGPGTEGMNVEEVRKVLQMRWDLFCGLPEKLQESLKTGELAAVNKVLGDMPVSEAENAVKALDMGGILSFAEEGIRDETGRATRVVDDDEYEDEDEDEDNR
ncbi:Cdc37 N terminal kinase binding-domain-containing protein [Multifurca ochricompacta]|uniref:Hsp90 chaperone protein kinase-targeting subunit n=1 Tax=Multifurca ochricompacta TaxID=376703 RepID=A0AAD4M775_9AGAM|nr:Cdc37 N terminal kinase binding-domain-containing protein [Multifurca ochricompacta]